MKYEQKMNAKYVRDRKYHYFLKTDYFTGQVCKDKRANPNVEQWKGWKKERIL